MRFNKKVTRLSLAINVVLLILLSYFYSGLIKNNSKSIPSYSDKNLVSSKRTVSMCDEVMKYVDKKETQKYEGEIASVDFSSLPEARLHRTMITKQVIENGADCAGHYNLSAWGGGMERQGYAIVDVITGRIIEYVPRSPFKVSSGISCSINSDILVLNPKIPTDINGYQSNGYKEERAVEEIAKESHEKESYEAGKARVYYQFRKDFSGDPHIYPVCFENIYAGVAKQ